MLRSAVNAAEEFGRYALNTIELGYCQSGNCNDNCCGWGFGIHVKTTDTRAGYIRNVLVRNNTIYNDTQSIVLQANYQMNYNGTLDIHPTRVENLTFVQNHVCGVTKRVRLACSPYEPCHNVTLVDNDFFSPFHGKQQRPVCSNVDSYHAQGNAHNESWIKCLEGARVG